MANNSNTFPEIEFSQFKTRSPQSLDQPTMAVVSQIIDEVQSQGEIAIRKFAERFGDLATNAPLVINREEMTVAMDRVSAKDLATLRRTAARIQKFAEGQRQSLRSYQSNADGITCGQEAVPVLRAGCYAPGGRYPLPSSVLMTAVTAKVAGVHEIIVASPRPNAITLAAAAIAGADKFLVIGGAQAIAALAFGCAELPPCDVIVGPGNRYVTAAKQLLQGRVGIDMLAGPSELVVASDGTGKPQIIAADLLAQAEHDPDAYPLFLSTCSRQIAAVQNEIQLQLQDLPTADVARAALQNGGAVLCPNLQQLAEVVNRIAPEHLSLQLSNIDEFKPLIHHYGALFEGEGAAEVLGDYGAGPNHVLPTETNARFGGGLSVFTFLRIRTWMRAEQGEVAEQLLQDVVSMARMEGLEAHARAAQQRLEAFGG